MDRSRFPQVVAKLVSKLATAQEGGLHPPGQLVTKTRLPEEPNLAVHLRVVNARGVSPNVFFRIASWFACRGFHTFDQERR